MEKAIKVGKVMLVEAALTLAALCLSALLLQRLQPSEGSIRIGVKILYAAVNFAGGFLIGRIMRQKKFLWGVVTGLTYFAVISLISFVVHQGFYMDIRHALTVCLLCVAGGMAGGMVS